MFDLDITAEELHLMKRESGWRTNAQNPTSTAFGLGQMIVANRNKYAPGCKTVPETEDAKAQICMMRAYIKASRYKTAEVALSHQLRNSWY